MTSKEWSDWKDFRNSGTETITVAEQKLIATLHAKYFNHKFRMPCSCTPSKARKQFQMWIDDLNANFESLPKPKIR
jgi:hypothetical protein